MNTLVAKTDKLYSIPKPFPFLKFVSKLLSFWLMMSMSVGKSIGRGQHITMQLPDVGNSA